MKKVFLSLLACGSIAAANAQGVLVFGDIGYTAQSRGTEWAGAGFSAKDEVKTSVFSFNPGIGYTINRNMAVGIQAQLAGIRVLTTSNAPGFKDVTDRGFDLVVGPFFRYTMPINQTFFTYGHVAVGYKTGNFRFGGTTEYTNKYNGFAAELYPAVGVNVTPRMALAFNIGGLGYDRYKWDNELDNTGTPVPSGMENHKTVSNFNFNFGQQMHLTVQWTFGGNKVRSHRAPGDDYREMRIDRDDRRRNDEE